MSLTSTKSKSDSPLSDEERIPRHFTSGLKGNMFSRLYLCWNERRFLAKVAAVGVVIGVLLAYLLPKQYQSSAQLMPPDNQSGSGMLLALAGGSNNGLGALASSLLGVKSSGEQFVGILQSRTVRNRLVDQFHLKKVYGSKFQEDACKELAHRTTIEVDRKSSIISLTVVDRDPQRARDIAEAYIGELDRLVAQLSTSAARREREFLEERLKAVKQDLDQAARDFSQFASKNAAIDISEQGKAMVMGAAALQGQLIAAESELKGLEQIYSSSNVRVRSVQARISELQHQLDKLGGGSPGETQSPIEEGANANYPSIRQLPILGVTYFDLLRRTKVQEGVYEALTKEYEMAKVQEAKEIPSVKVLDRANLPEKRAFPPRALVVFLCVCFCLGVAVGVLLLRERWEEIDSGDPGKLLAHEVLQTVNAHMPWATPNGSRIQASTHQVWIRFTRRKEVTKQTS